MALFERTPYGFIWGAANIKRLFSHNETVTLGMKTPRTDIQIYVTRTGFVRVFDKNGEWRKP